MLQKAKVKEAAIVKGIPSQADWLDQLFGNSKHLCEGKVEHIPKEWHDQGEGALTLNQKDGVKMRMLRFQVYPSTLLGCPH